MKPRKQLSWWPIVTAFVIGFAHFMVIWAASESWAHQWMANAVAWAATAIALLALGVHWLRVKARHAAGELSDWNHHFALGAVAIATVAVVFSALPSLFFLP